MPKVTKLFEPGMIGTMELRNRIVMAPIGSQFFDERGYATQTTIDYYAARAKGGVGLVDSGATRVPYRQMISEDTFVAKLKKVTDAVHQHGAKMAQQLFHFGMSQPNDPIGPSPELYNNFLPVPVMHMYPEGRRTPRVLSREEIKEFVLAFAEAARRAKDAGFDAIEVHGAHGYLVTQFLSPRTNRRTDEYGGSPEKRARFACELIEAVKRKNGPDFPVMIRMDGDNYVEGGITIDQAVRQAPLFVEAGADALHVSAGSWEGETWHQLTYMHPSGALAHLAAAVKKAVKVPVIACGKINDPLMAERFLEEGVADFIAVGRQLLADPEWPNKAKQGRLDEINQCINCNGCFYTILMQRSPLTCTINPAVGREEEFQIRPARSPKKVMVIGGGLAGMETARIAAERGHQVSLYEKSDKLGGQWNIGSQQEYKQHFGEVTQRKSAQLTKAGVRVLLNQEVTREMVEKTKPDVVVLATGAIPATLEAPGADGKNVVQANDVILGKARVGQRVVVIGGRYVGMEVALALAEQGKRVHLLTRRMLGRDTEANILETLRDKLFEAGGHITEDTAVVEITSASVKARVKYSPLERPMVVPADTVVLAVGDKAENRLAKELHGVAPEVYSVGDCVEPRDAMHAIREGAEVGLAI